MEKPGTNNIPFDRYAWDKSEEKLTNVSDNAKTPEYDLN
jgi:hypothetical protein